MDFDVTMAYNNNFKIITTMNWQFVDAMLTLCWGGPTTIEHQGEIFLAVLLTTTTGHETTQNYLTSALISYCWSICLIIVNISSVSYKTSPFLKKSVLCQTINVPQIAQFSWNYDLAPGRGGGGGRVGLGSPLYAADSAIKVFGGLFLWASMFL